MKYILACVLLSVSVFAQSLQQRIESVTSQKKATVCVAAKHLESAERAEVNATSKVVMQSVYKFHLAVLVFHQIDKGRYTLDKKLYMSKRDAGLRTWSPLAKKYVGGDVWIPLREVLQYTISQSDNVGCDMMFRLVGGTRAVNSYMQKLGFRNLRIKATEEQMHTTEQTQFTNWITAACALDVLERVYTSSILSPQSKKELWRMMEETTSGAKRMKGLLPDGTVVAHKTGSSGTNDQGLTTACNDIGVVTLPNGNHIALTVFVQNSTESEETNERIIAEVTRVVYDYFVSKK